MAESSGGHIEVGGSSGGGGEVGGSSGGLMEQEGASGGFCLSDVEDESSASSDNDGFNEEKAQVRAALMIGLFLSHPSTERCCTYQSKISLKCWYKNK